MTRSLSIAASLLVALGQLAADIAAQPALQIIDVFPSNHAVAAEPWGEIIVRFNQPIDASALDENVIRVFGRWSGPAAGRFEPIDDGSGLRFAPDEPFFAGESVTVNISNTLASRSGDLLTSGYVWSYWVRTLPGSTNQHEVMRIAVRQEGEGLLVTYGAYAGDVNDDGWSDLTVINEFEHDIRVFLNDQRGFFVHHANHFIGEGTFPSPSEGGDFNGDGLIDLAVAGMRNDRVAVFLADRQGVWGPPAIYQTNGGNRCLALLDLDADGDDDLVTSSTTASNLSTLINEGSGVFDRGANIETTLNQEFSCVATDADNDGVVDLLVGSDQPENALTVLYGNGRGGFYEGRPLRMELSATGLAAGDMNGDGIADAVAISIRQAGVTVAYGDGRDGFSSRASFPTGQLPIAVDLGDLDGDGDLDVVTSDHGSVGYTVYENDGTGRLINPVKLSAEAAASCAILHDRDNDGDLDITVTDERADLIILHENRGSSTAADDAPQAQAALTLEIYPNPGSGPVHVRFRLPAAAHVSLHVFDSEGRLVKALVDRTLPAGEHEAIIEGLSGGLYFARLRAGARSQSAAIVVIPTPR